VTRVYVTDNRYLISAWEHFYFNQARRFWVAIERLPECEPRSHDVEETGVKYYDVAVSITMPVQFPHP
jgi:hypothetical protein